MGGKSGKKLKKYATYTVKVVPVKLIDNKSGHYQFKFQNMPIVAERLGVPWFATFTGQTASHMGFGKPFKVQKAVYTARVADYGDDDQESRSLSPLQRLYRWESRRNVQEYW